MLGGCQLARNVHHGSRGAKIRSPTVLGRHRRVPFCHRRGKHSNIKLNASPSVATRGPGRSAGGKLLCHGANELDGGDVRLEIAWLREAAYPGAPNGPK